MVRCRSQTPPEWSVKSGESAAAGSMSTFRCQSVTTSRPLPGAILYCLATSGSSAHAVAPNRWNHRRSLSRM
jgi:hypothetical protein